MPNKPKAPDIPRVARARESPVNVPVPVPVPEGPEESAVHGGENVFHERASMVRQQLDERQWQKVQAVLRAKQGVGRPGNDDRNFIEAVLWWRRTGVPWRDLPTEFGSWKTVFNRFDRWAKRGRWNHLFDALQSDRDDEWHSLDSTVNRAH